MFAKRLALAAVLSVLTLRLIATAEAASATLSVTRNGNEVVVYAMAGTALTW